MKLTVAVRRRQKLLRTQTVDGGVVRIGTHPKAAIQVEDDPEATRMHAVVEMNDEGATLIDLGSEAGTWVNGKKVNRCKLHVGDEIRVGATSILVEALGEQ